MSSKIGTILSSIFIILAFLFSCDLMTIQFTYADLDAKSVNISYLISRAPELDRKFWNYIYERYDVGDITCDKEGPTVFGEEIHYEISKPIKPLIISNENMIITLKRMTIVGYYG